MGHAYSLQVVDEATVLFALPSKTKLMQNSLTHFANYAFMYILVHQVLGPVLATVIGPTHSTPHSDHLAPFASKAAEFCLFVCLLVCLLVCLFFRSIGIPSAAGGRFHLPQDPFIL